MISDDLTYNTFGYYSTDLSRCSTKKVIAICNNCKVARIISFKDYSDLCHKCCFIGMHPTKSCECLICGIKLIGVNNSTKYCINCSKELQLERSRIYKRNHRNQIRKTKKKYYDSHPEKKVETNKRYREKHKEELSIRRIDYNKKYNNSEKGKINSHNGKIKRLERLNNIVHSFSYDDWLNKLNATNGYCPKCKTFVGIESLTLDHIIPISKAEVGFIYTIDDVRVLCRKCNCSKGNKI